MIIATINAEPGRKPVTIASGDFHALFAELKEMGQPLDEVHIVADCLHFGGNYSNSTNTIQIHLKKQQHAKLSD